MTNYELYQLQTMFPINTIVVEAVVNGKRVLVPSSDFKYLQEQEKSFLQEYGDVPIIYTDITSGACKPSPKISVLSKSLAQMGLDYIDNESNE